jgi:hypothetical protein
MFGEDTAASILPAALLNVLVVASGSAVPVGMLPLPILSTILSALDIKKFNSTRNPPSETRSSNVTTVVQRMFSYLDSFRPSQIRLLFSCAVSLVLLLRLRRI